MPAADTAIAAPSGVNPDSVQVAAPMRQWKKRFIPAGQASGIMVEFTGMKKEKQLRARYCVIELEPSPTVTPSDTKMIPPRTLTLVSIINELRQAFFKAPPGTYIFRQTKEWADRTPVTGVEVREGNYSLINVDVFQAWLEKDKTVSEDGKP